MEVDLQPERGASASATQEGPSSSASSLGWPFGLSTCVAIHAPSPKEQPPSPALAFQQQFANLQSTFLLPFFSDVGESSSSDSEVRSEAASSFFKDSRRITLGSLIGLPMDHSFHHFDGAQFHDIATTTPRRTLQHPSCGGILELLRCVRTYSDPGLSSDQEGEPTAMTATTATTTTPEGGEDTSRTFDNVDNGAALSTCSSHSPDWNDQFVSCHSVLSSTEAAHHIASSPNPSPSPIQKPHRMQRSASMKSFFSSICCRIDAVQRP